MLINRLMNECYVLYYYIHTSISSNQVSWKTFYITIVYALPTLIIPFRIVTMSEGTGLEEINALA